MKHEGEPSKICHMVALVHGASDADRGMASRHACSYAAARLIASGVEVRRPLRASLSPSMTITLSGPAGPCRRHFRLTRTPGRSGRSDRGRPRHRGYARALWDRHRKRVQTYDSRCGMCFAPRLSSSSLREEHSIARRTRRARKFLANVSSDTTATRNQPPETEGATFGFRGDRRGGQ